MLRAFRWNGVIIISRHGHVHFGPAEHIGAHQANWLAHGVAEDFLLALGHAAGAEQAAKRIVPVPMMSGRFVL